MSKRKKLTRREKTEAGIQKPDSESKYGRKHTLQRKGIFNPDSPFELTTNENSKG